MEEFKMRIKRRIILFSGMVLMAVALGVYSFITMDNSSDASFTDGSVAGFQFGIILGIGVLAFIQIIKLRKVLKDERSLKVRYNQEHDERLKTIRSKAGMPLLMITSLIMLIAAIIGSRFNIVVFYTLVIAAMVQLTIGALVKLYCLKTM